MGILSVLGNAAGAATSKLGGAGAGALVSSLQNKAFGGLGGAGPSRQSDDFIHPYQREDYVLNIVRVGDGSRRNINVRAMLPEDFTFDLGSNWDTPFAENLVKGDKTNLVAQMLGMKFATQATSANFWTGSAPVEWSFPLIITAETGYNDVLAPVRDLIELSVPTVEGGFFQAPGPRFHARKVAGDLVQSTKNLVTGKTTLDNSNTTPPKDTQTAKDSGSTLGKAVTATTDLFQYDGQIQLQIGTFMLIPSVVITNVSQAYKMIMGPDGVPMQVTVNINVRTHTTPSAEDVKGWFQRSISEGTQGNPLY
jgi:hypothetical protein